MKPDYAFPDALYAALKRMDAIIERPLHCTAKGCTRPIYCKGLCSAHYQQQKLARKR